MLRTCCIGFCCWKMKARVGGGRREENLIVFCAGVNRAKLGRSCDRYFDGWPANFTSLTQSERPVIEGRDHSLTFPHVSLMSCFPMSCAFALTHYSTTNLVQHSIVSVVFFLFRIPFHSFTAWARAITEEHLWENLSVFAE